MKLEREIDLVDEDESSEIPAYCNFSFDLVKPLRNGGEQRVHDLEAEKKEDIPEDGVNRESLRNGEVIKIVYDEKRRWPVRVIHDHSAPDREKIFFGRYKFVQIKVVPFKWFEGNVWKILSKL